MDFELTRAMQFLGEETERYFIDEALLDPDITFKRAASEALRDLRCGDAVHRALNRMRLI
jgi:hypothetical protein